MENRVVSLRRNLRGSFPTWRRGARWESSIILAIKPASEFVTGCARTSCARTSERSSVAIRRTFYSWPCSDQEKIEDSRRF